MYLRFQCLSSTTDIGCKIVYGTDWSEERLNHWSERSSDGTRTTYDVGPTLVRCNIVMKDVSKADASLLRTFLRSTCVYSLVPFSIAQMVNVSGDSFAAGEGVDLGKGSGVTVSNVRFPQDNTEGVFQFLAPGKYDVNFPIEYVRA